MKSSKDFRGATNVSDKEDSRKGTKLPPMKKSGKERYELYSELADEEDDVPVVAKRESVFDYFDDGEEDDL